jgi:hypothetical protein
MAKPAFESHPGQRRPTTQTKSGSKGGATGTRPNSPKG